MKHLLLILISFFLLSSPVIGDSHKGETLYKWGEKPDYKWMGFGDKDTHPVYKGQVENGKPNGLGVLNTPNGYKYVGEFKNGNPNGQGINTFPDGDKFVGEFKEGNIWNVKHYDKEGKVTETCVNGEWDIFLIKFNSSGITQ